MILKIKRVNAYVWEPYYRHVNDSGFDLVAVRDTQLLPGATAVIGTGIAVEIDTGEHWYPDALCLEIQIRPRSSMSKSGILCHFGTIDSGYRGEIMVALTNLSDETKYIHQGDRIAQAVVCPVYRPEIVFVDELSTSTRGENGFGSTGK